MSGFSHQLQLRNCRGESEFAELVEVWRSAVLASHDFLSEADFLSIETRLASDYLPAVELTVAEYDQRIVGFSGVLDGVLEMLFVAADARGQGVGSVLLAAAISAKGVHKVDVNEQNTAAHQFYLQKGFVDVSRSDTDSAGRPYPIIHMEHPHTRSKG